jgi:acyl dehydratase
MAQGTHQVYARVLRPGDRVYVRSEILNCSPLKTTRVGPGYFLTQLDTYYNQNDEIVGTDLMSILWYGFSD